jgi:hypothetical protein
MLTNRTTNIVAVRTTTAKYFVTAQMQPTMAELPVLYNPAFSDLNVQRGQFGQQE